MKPNDEVKPPRWANLLLKWFCSKEVIETLQGDLYELYEIRKRQGKLHADLGFISDVFSSMRPFARVSLNSPETTFSPSKRHSGKSLLYFLSIIDLSPCSVT